MTARDEQGNPVGGATVVPTSSDPATSTFTPASAATNGSGVATFSFSATRAKDFVVSVRANDAQLNQKPTVKVTRASSTTRITGFQPPSSTALQAVSVTFSVSGPSGGSPLGAVAVTDGSVSCSGLVAEGQCTLTPTTGGTKTFKANYLGDANFEPSSDTQLHQIDPMRTATALDQPLPLFTQTSGKPVTLRATVQALPPGVPDGNVSFRDNSCGSGGSPLGNAPLQSGVATLILVAGTGNLGVGQHKIFACYGGTQTFGSSEDGPRLYEVTAKK